MRFVAFILAVTIPTTAWADQVGDVVSFVTCPVYRDTDSGRKSGCWLADNPASGQRYDVSQSPYKPDINFEIWVEGRVSQESPAPCGATVLNAVRTSRLDIPCKGHILPAEGYKGRKYSLPRRNNDPLGVPRPVVSGPFSDRTFTTYFEFGRDFIVYQYDDWLLDQAANWIRQAHPKRLIITGFAVTEPAVLSGRTLAEPQELASDRAAMIAQTMHRLIPDIPIEVKWAINPAPTNEPEADGLPGQSRRRTEIEARF